MGAKIFASCALITMLIFVGVSTYEVGTMVEEIISEVEKSEDYEQALEAERVFQDYEKFISITVSHEDLMSIEDIFSQYVAERKANDEQAQITKSRLINALTHLGRLSKINIDSVI